MCGRAYRHSAQKEMMQCAMCRKHVHSDCDPEANENSVLEKRAAQYNYMYVCKMCKTQQSRAAAVAHQSGAAAGGSASAAAAAAVAGALGFNEDSNDGNWEDGDMEGRAGGSGFGKGKPMVAFPGKRGRRGAYGLAGGFMRSRSYPATNAGVSGASGVGGVNKPGVAGVVGTKKRGAVEAAVVRRRGRQPKIRGMVGLQVS